MTWSRGPVASIATVRTVQRVGQSGLSVGALGETCDWRVSNKFNLLGENRINEPVHPKVDGMSIYVTSHPEYCFQSVWHTEFYYYLKFLHFFTIPFS